MAHSGRRKGRRSEYDENDSADALGKRSKYRDTDDQERHAAGGSLFDNPYSVKPSTNRRAAKYTSHEIEQLEPASASSETMRERAHREAHNDYSHTLRKRSRRFKVIAGVVIALFALAIAGISARTVYVHSFDSRLGDGLEADVAGKLTEATSGQADYSLLVGLADSDDGTYVADTIMVARVDQTDGTIVLLSIPNNTRVYLNGYGYCALQDARAYGGQKLLLATVSDLLGIDFSHYIEADVGQFNDVVDVLGGIEMDVPANTNVGGVTVAEGTHTLDGEQVTLVSRCWQSYSRGIAQRLDDQNILLSKIITALVEAPSSKTLKLMDTLSSSLSTDLTYDQLVTARKALSACSIHLGTMPYSTKTVSGTTYSILDDDSWASIFDAMDSGDTDAFDELFATSAEQAEAFDPSGWKITVRNGSGVKGCATQAADKLTGAGFSVIGTGNADQFVYDETLVIYANDSDVTAVENVITALGVGRAVQNTGSYVYDGDILVVVGKDWVP